MLLTLMRHGIAEPYTGSDAGRELTPEGVSIVHRVVLGLKASGWLPGGVVCSPLIRSQQTAAVILEHYPGLPQIVLREVIATEDNLLEEIGYHELVDPVVVGHEPGISRLAADLIGAAPRLRFEPATVAGYRLDGFPPRQPAQLLFYAPPSFARCVG